VNFKGKKTL